MITIRRAADRGHFDHGWLSTWHTFSFADYHDPAHMGFSVLRVINEDVVQPGQGFGKHGHRDMEIVTWILAGALRHEDSTGSKGVIRPGELQRMSAGTGVMHSEVNASDREPVHLLQIWLLPERRGLPPSYEQKDFGREFHGRLRLLVSPDGRDGSVRIGQDATISVCRLAPAQRVEHAFARGRHGWLQVARGSVQVDGQALAQGDGAAIGDLPRLAVEAVEPSEVLLFDLP